MKIFELEGKEYMMPEGWHEVNLGLFERIVEHTDNLSEYKSNIQFALEMLSILLGMPFEDLKRLNRASFEALSDACQWTNDPIEPTNKKEFEINGDIYVPLSDLNQITMGENIDLEILATNSKGNEMLTNILPILIRKAIPKSVKGKTKLIPSEYDSSQYDDTKELFREHLMVADVIGLRDSFFFGEK